MHETQKGEASRHGENGERTVAFPMPGAYSPIAPLTAFFCRSTGRM